MPQWSLVLVTGARTSQESLIKNELRSILPKGCELHVIADPFPSPSSLSSLLNALLMVAEFSTPKWKFIRPDIFQNSTMLVIDASSATYPGSGLNNSIHANGSLPVSQLLNAYMGCTEMLNASMYHNGLWYTDLNRMLCLEELIWPTCEKVENAVVGLTNGSGLSMWLSPPIVGEFLKIVTSAPFFAATYAALDNDVIPLRLSIVTHFLNYLSNEAASNDDLAEKLYASFNKYSYITCNVPSEINLPKRTDNSIKGGFLHSILKKCDVQPNVHVQNSVVKKSMIGARAVIMNSIIDECVVGENSQLDGVDIIFASIPSNAIIFKSHLVKAAIFVGFGKHDDCNEGNFFMKPLDQLVARLNISENDLFEENCERTLFTARLFNNCLDNILSLINLQSNSDVVIDKVQVRNWLQSERYSLKQIYASADASQYITNRNDLLHKISDDLIRQSFTLRNHQLLTPYYMRKVSDGRADELLALLDELCLEAANSNDYCCITRIFSHTADVLNLMDNRIRFGGSNHPAFQPALKLFKDNLLKRVQLMIDARRQWLSNGGSSITAARNYDAATQHMINITVSLSHVHINPFKTLQPLSPSQWASAECPARIDLFGGWSDTPPQCYIVGGAVINLSLSIDGKKPIGARCKRIPGESSIILVQTGLHPLVCTSPSDLVVVSPTEKCALLKAVFTVLEISPLDANGYQLETWSNLPLGSGLGTSSILAGCALAAVARAACRSYDLDALNHLVLMVEQVMTTGGGWQDQVGGMIPGGLKISRSEPTLPVKITYEMREMSDAARSKLEEKLCLVYCGVPRLAKNILQQVVNNFLSGSPEIETCIRELTAWSEKYISQIQAGNLEILGEALNRYYDYKLKIVASTEPPFLTSILNRLREICCGVCLAGAGGGGVIICLLQNDKTKCDLEQICGGDSQLSILSSSIDTEGLIVKDVEI